MVCYLDWNADVFSDMKAHKILVIGTLALWPFRSISQPLYDRNQAVSYSKSILVRDKGKPGYYFNGYRLEFRNAGNNKSSLVLLYKTRVIQHFFSAGLNLNQMPRFALVADLNGDGIKDLKISIPSNGASPIAREASFKIYLLSKNQKKFSKLSFFDCSSEVERDMDSDGRYEIFSRELYSYKGHSYWKHEIYSIVGNSLSNVSLKYNHPILLRFNMPAKFTVPLIPDSGERKRLCSGLPQQFDLEQ